MAMTSSTTESEYVSGNAEEELVDLVGVNPTQSFPEVLRYMPRIPAICVDSIYPYIEPKIVSVYDDNNEQDRFEGKWIVMVFLPHLDYLWTRHSMYSLLSNAKQFNEMDTWLIIVTPGPWNKTRKFRLHMNKPDNRFHVPGLDEMDIILIIDSDLKISRVFGMTSNSREIRSDIYPGYFIFTPFKQLVEFHIDRNMSDFIGVSSSSGLNLPQFKYPIFKEEVNGLLNRVRQIRPLYDLAKVLNDGKNHINIEAAIYHLKGLTEHTDNLDTMSQKSGITWKNLIEPFRQAPTS